MKERGFTVVELLVAVVALIGITVLFWTQFQNAQSMSRDDSRRTAINAMYYNLEDVYYTKNGYYPQNIDEKNLTAMDAALFTDPNGNKIGTSSTDYAYLPTNCANGKCKSYSLRSVMEHEADYIKTSRH